MSAGRYSGIEEKRNLIRLEKFLLPGDDVLAGLYAQNSVWLPKV